MENSEEQSAHSEENSVEQSAHSEHYAESKKQLAKDHAECQELSDVCRTIKDCAGAMSSAGPTPTNGDVILLPAADDVRNEAPPVEVEVVPADTLNDDTGNNEEQQQQQQQPREPLSMITSEEMDMAELKVRVVCQEKNNMALRMELKCAELQLAAKEKIDAKKTRLVELLDAKMANIEKKNLKLVEMMEQVVKDKDTHSKRLVDATNNMEELGRKLRDSERIRQELRTMNNELKKMLESVEGKGTKIAALAREKVLKYKGENERMQREMDGMKDTAAAAEAAPQETEVVAPFEIGAGVFWASVEEAEALRQKLSEQLGPVGEEAPVEKLREVLGGAAAIAGELGQSLERLRQSAVDLVAASASTAVVLEAQNAELKQQAEARKSGEATQLEAKDREMAALTDELQRLKSAIGQLVGLNAVAALSSPGAAP